MKIKGIKRGQTIELLEQIDNIADVEVTVKISALAYYPLANFSVEERQNKISQVLGAWKDNTQIDEIFREIERDRF